MALAVLGLHYLAGVLATGGQLDWPLQWLDSVSAYQEADFRANGWQAISLPALGTRLELATGLPGLALLGYLVGLAIIVACLPALRRLPLLDAVALAAALGLLVSPHAWVYDATLLLPALAVFAARSAGARLALARPLVAGGRLRHRPGLVAGWRHRPHRHAPGGADGAVRAPRAGPLPAPASAR